MAGDDARHFAWQPPVIVAESTVLAAMC